MLKKFELPPNFLPSRDQYKLEGKVFSPLPSPKGNMKLKFNKPPFTNKELHKVVNLVHYKEATTHS